MRRLRSSGCCGTRLPNQCAMLSHISLGVSDLERSIFFYDAILATLGYVRVWRDADAAGYGRPGGDDEFAIKHHKGVLQRSSYRSHVAFNASENDAARHFHATALIHGADDEGAPGFCPEYGEGYFAAFVRDLDGYRLEAKVLPNNL